ARLGGIEEIDDRRGTDRRAGKRPAGGEGPILGAESGIVAHPQRLVREIAADQPVEHAVERRALQPQLLAEGSEATVGIAIVGTVEDVDIAIIEIAGATGLVTAIGRDG